MLYLIKLIENKISLSEYDSDTKIFEKIKKNGEIWQEFEEGEFWRWFQKKIDYEEEELSFAIVSDRETFAINPMIQLSKINFVKNRSDISQLLMSEIDANTQLYFIPHFENTTQKKQIKITPKKQIKKESLSEYYANRTKLYQGL